ncbi:MAG TPA: SpoIIE family protein phosphatase [Vicinamibacterales bacterium]|nr:SpoIIE family protein phosphatase [Vicinamibacterales bacterium]HPW21271.1 SpoIIE family protein phosphatase [Vicinamibacterales bacterium]
MTLRTRLSLAFFFISVVPLAVVTAYSYYSSAAALRHAVEAQADQMASEMGDRLTWVMADLGERVERLWRMRVQEPAALGAPRTAGALPSVVANSETLQHLAAAMLAEAAPLVRRLEFSSAADAAAVPGSAGAPPAQAPAQAESGGGRTGGRGGRARGAWQAPGAPSAGRAPASGPRGPAGRPQPPPGVPVVSPGMPKVVIDMPTARAAAGSANSEALFEALTPEAVNAWRRAIQRQAEMDADPAGIPPRPPAPPPSPQPGQPSASGAPDGQAGAPAFGRAPSAGAAGLSASELRALRDRRRAERAERMKALATGEALQFEVRRAGQLIGTISATVDRNRIIETVLSLGRRERGEVPFVMDSSGEIHALDPAGRRAIEALRLAPVAPGRSASTTLAGDVLVVTRRDPSGIVFGLARPLRDSLRDMRRASLGNLAVGLLFIGGAFAMILPLASRLTRHLAALNAGVQRLAAGDRHARVAEDAPDEVGELARSFNRMAAELEVHDRMLAKQERLARELELGRQIQTDMLPRGPLKTSFAEVAGVSIPAREVGGDFFNYFALEDGRIALLVGDVSGKGVGAALLMANIQATLRARLQLESDLAQLADAVDHDIAANTPPEVYATLFAGVMDPAGRELRYVNAGHNPQFLLRAGGGLQRLESTGLPIGLLPGRGYVERRVGVERGDLLFLYTDGAIEAPNESGEFFDADRLQRELVEASALDVDALLVRIERALRAFRGRAEPADDATMMALRLSPAR